MLLLGIDLGTSSIKVSIVDAATANVFVSATYPESETPILSRQAGWAEQWPKFLRQIIQRQCAYSAYRVFLRPPAQRNICLSISD